MFPECLKERYLDQFPKDDISKEPPLQTALDILEDLDGIPPSQ